MPPINYEITLFFTWSSNSVLTKSPGAGAFVITDTKLYFPIVTLSPQDPKLLQKLKSGFKQTMN